MADELLVPMNTNINSDDNYVIDIKNDDIEILQKDDFCVAHTIFWGLTIIIGVFCLLAFLYMFVKIIIIIYYIYNSS